MKLSNLSIIFVIIILPIILVFSYYISLQIDTINMQTAYSTKQLEATKEAVEAFEINTVEWNESYSKNADSKRRDVMASINTFTTSFANGIGIGGTNKENILSYIPAIACTLHDGYYIYTPSEMKSVIKDKNGVAVFLTEALVKSDSRLISGYSYKKEDEGKLLYKCKEDQEPDGTYNGEKFTLDTSKAESTYQHILKPFSTYSARYKTEDKDITINYTLDSYITIYGTINDEYVSKSGYLISFEDKFEPNTELLTERIWYKGIEESKLQKRFPYVYSEDNVKVYFDGNTTFIVNSNGIRTNLEDYTSPIYKKMLIKNEDNSYYTIYQALVNYDMNNDGYISEENDIIAGKWYKTKGNIYSERTINIGIKEDVSAKNYYVESRTFTNWVQKNLADIKIGDIEIEYQYNNELSKEENEKNKQELKELYGNVDDKIFDISIDPESEDSIIVNHKREVIKQSLISNLNQAITSYSRNSEKEFKMPQLTETDWNHILRNVSIVTFVQEIPIGLKYYNNYAIATSSQNNDYISPDELYFSRLGDSYYHMPYCSHLDSDNLIIGYRNTDYVLKAYKDGENINHYYRHSTQTTANQKCYYCLVQRDLYEEDITQEKKIAYKTALARERYNFFKVEEEEDFYLYNYGNEYKTITGGWHPNIMGTYLSSNSNSEMGAVYEKANSYLKIGDKSTTAGGDGTFVTGNRIKEIADYDYLTIKFKVSDCKNMAEKAAGFSIYLQTVPLFIEYQDYSNDREHFKYKLVGEKLEEGKYTEYKDVSYVEDKTQDEVKSYIQGIGHVNGSKYSSGKSGIHYVNYYKLWDSKIVEGESQAKYIGIVGDIIEVKIKISDNTKKAIRENGGCHIALRSYAHQSIKDTIDIEIYQVYLTNEKPQQYTTESQEPSMETEER